MVTEYNNFKLPQRWDGDAYTRQLLGLLPRGLAWVFDKFLLYSIIQDVILGDGWQDTYTSIAEVQDVIRTRASGHLLTRLLSCFGEELARAESEAWRLINQTDPGVATDTLEDWERVLGLPEDCFADQVLTEEERQRQAHAKLFSKYEVTDLDFYLDYATELGFDIMIVQIPIEYSPRIMGVARMGVERMGGRGGFSILQVIIVSGTSDSDLLKCAFSKVKQAHVVITYVGPEFVGPELFVDGDMEVTGPDVIVDGDMEVTGPDVIIDGDMEAVGVAAYGVGNAATLTKDVTDPHGGTQALRIARNAVDNPYASQVILTTTKTYRARGWARGDAATGVPVLKDSSGATLWTGTNSTSYQEFDVVFVAAGTGLWLYSNATAGTDFVQFDDVEVIDETVACAAWSKSNVLASKQGDAYEALQCIRLAQTIAFTSAIVFQTILTIGKTYRIKGWARSDGTLIPGIVNTVYEWTGTTSTDWQAFDFAHVALGTSLLFRSVSGYGDIGDYVEFDDVSVIDETVACADWTAGADTILSKQNDAYEGTQCLRVEQTVALTSGIALQTILAIGEIYRIKGWARSDGVLIPQTKDDSGAGPWTGTTSTDWQEINVVFIAGSQVYQLESLTGYGDVGDYVEFDIVSIKAEF